MRPATDLLEVAWQQFAWPEYERLLHLPESIRHEAFYAIWTCKEAYVKARGIIPFYRFVLSTGAAKTLALLSDESNPRQIGQWSFSLLQVGTSWCAALVTPKADLPLKCWSLVSQGISGTL